MGGYSRYNVLTRLLLGAMEEEGKTLIRLCNIYIVILFGKDPEIDLPQCGYSTNKSDIEKITLDTM